MAWTGNVALIGDPLLLGPAAGCPNLWLANGSSGHGVMHAPALGLRPHHDQSAERHQSAAKPYPPDERIEGDANFC